MRIGRFSGLGLGLGFCSARILAIITGANNFVFVDGNNFVFADGNNFVFVES